MLKSNLLGGAMLLMLPASAMAQAASPATAAANAAAAKALPAEDGQDQDFVNRGFIATWPEKQILRDDGKGLAWDFAQFEQLKGPAPASVNPSLWRHSGLLAKHGLFETPRADFPIVTP